MSDTSAIYPPTFLSSGLSETLNGFLDRLAETAEFEVVEELIASLAGFYDDAASRGSLAEFRAACQNHPLHRYLLQDPFTERAFRKPRGYAGDAVMLDYIYRPAPLSLSEIGRIVHSATTAVSSAQSIVWRRDHLATEIGKTVGGIRASTILSVASGHLRELDIVRELTDRRDLTIDALDQDEGSLQEAVNSYPDFNIRPIHRSITHLFRTESRGTYDLIYSAGLFDYLSARAGAALLRKLLGLLRSDGRLIVANYATDNFGRGFMEGMMDWRLLYRGENDMTDLISRAGSRIEHRTYRDAPGNVVYLEISEKWN